MTKHTRAHDLDRTCPHCGGRGAPIFWGMPARDSWSLITFFDVAVGGCCVPVPTPGWRCDACEREFGDADEVDWSPMDRLVEYRDAVSREMKRVYAIAWDDASGEWDDASGEWEPLAKALDEGGDGRAVRRLVGRELRTRAAHAFATLKWCAAGPT